MAGKRQDPFHLYVGVDDTKLVIALLKPWAAAMRTPYTVAAITTIQASYVVPKFTLSAGPPPASQPVSGRPVAGASPATQATAEQAYVRARIGTEPPLRWFPRVWLSVMVVSALALGATERLSAWWLGPTILATAAVTGGLATQLGRRRIRKVWASGHRVLLNGPERDTFQEAHSAVEHIDLAWPGISRSAGLDEPGTVLARGLWDLAGVLAERQTVRLTREKLEQAAHAASGVDALLPEVSARLSAMTQLIERLDADIARRLRYVYRLAEEVDAFLTRYGRLAQAIRESDAVLGRLDAAPRTADAGEELAETTAAILSAYRELAAYPQAAPATVP
jgi:hypothetical protein